ncbi:conserved hypothetical protein [Sporisorium reilianum SRZ2]|uniref:Uncharacterized protein n=1 Tax=Sporisorium reilianum (strain SRZ2) TaxID=999809 RepID=E6ZZE2_SPORE|nr:conserved hypothetical protein [Sporisorium reilianum SRZ2]
MIPPSLLLAPLILSLLTLLTPATTAGVDPATLSTQPYQYFHSDGVGGSNAACWLSRVPFPAIDGVTCRFADTISQLKGRQIWQCDGDQRKFCDGCHELEAKLTDPKELVAWKVQGC